MSFIHATWDWNGFLKANSFDELLQELYNMGRAPKKVKLSIKTKPWNGSAPDNLKIELIGGLADMEKELMALQKKFG